ncbi:MAG: hypothetical protein J0653_05460, partial [Deltaproteobacteria bacterium]|nr:hypothetical protein [Deltaproteobacteria bacterium]
MNKLKPPQEPVSSPQDLSQETISELYAQQCAAEPIHQLGTVQPHGFIMVIDLATQKIVQVSTGVLRHWQGLGEVDRLIGTLLTDWILPGRLPSADWLLNLPEHAPQDLDLYLRELRADHASSSCKVPLSGFECVGHRLGQHAVL